MSILDDIRPSKGRTPEQRRAPAPPSQRTAGRFKKGMVANPAGRPPVPRELVVACRLYTPRALECLQEIVERFMNREGGITGNEARAAAGALLDRAWGTAPQVVRIEAAESEDTLALHPSALDLDALAHLAALVRHLPAAPSLERVTLESPGRALAAVATGSGEGIPSEGLTGPDAE